jgi:hypothetical protein
MAADTRRVFPEKGAYEDGQSNLVRINEFTWLAAAGSFPVAGEIASRTVNAFRQVFEERKVDPMLLLESEATVRDMLTQAYNQVRGESLPTAHILIGGVSDGDEPYLVVFSSTSGFHLKIIREPFTAACLDLPKPLDEEIKASLSPLKNRLSKEPLEERRLKAATAALRNTLAQVAAGSTYFAPEGEIVVISAKGSILTPIKPK